MSTASSSGSIADDISLSVRLSPDEDCEFREITLLTADILIRRTDEDSMEEETKIGSIKALLLDRRRIPHGRLYSAFDGHSGELQWIGCALMEPRQGRTKLESLRKSDDPELDFMYISKFHVDDEYKNHNNNNNKNGASDDVAAVALRKLLHIPKVCDRVCTVAYVLDAEEGMTPEEMQAYDEYQSTMEPYWYEDKVMGGEGIPDHIKAARKEWSARMVGFARRDANAFLRNGFFQDPAIAKDSEANSRILVASVGHFSAPLKSHAEAAAIRFYIPEALPAEPTGKDGELHEYVMTTCAHWDYTNPKPPIRQDVQALLCAGASVSRSFALHVACANNTFEMVQLLVQLERAAINSYDNLQCTPLMLAAESAAGRSTMMHGIPETRVIDYLLKQGADRNLPDKSSGMTAYGHFKSRRAQLRIMMQAMTGNPLNTAAAELHPTEQVIETRLMPPRGPTRADTNGGKPEGIIDYSADDDDDDEMCHDVSYGDY